MIPQFIPLALLVATFADDPSPATTSPADLVLALETAVADAIARAEPSVVAIAREKSSDERTTAIRGRPSPAPVPPAMLLDPLQSQNLVSYDYGSGVVIGDRGQILTAYHVVQGASRLVVRAAGRQFFEAEVLAADPRSDLAVIAPRLEPGAPAPSLKPIAIGDANALRKGSFLLALGNPFNAARDGAASAGWGILANTSRRIEESFDERGTSRKLHHYPILLQLDAKLNMGMSGGAVVNLKGELVGITTATASASGFDAQAGYAIPIDRLIRRVIEALEQGKEAEYGFLGIQLDNQNNTNRVLTVQPNAPAAEGGLLSGDQIVSVEGIGVTDADSLALAIGSQPVGEPVRLRIYRQGQDVEKTIILAKYPVEGPIIATNRPRPWRGLAVDFTSVLRSGIFDVGMHTAFVQGGVAITAVAPGSPAASAGLKKDQVITHIGDRPVRSPSAFHEAVANLDGPVILTTDLGKVTIGK